jgi:hypothetical protein
VDLADLGTLIRERREALELSQSRLARFSFIRVREAASHCAGRWWGMEEEWRSVALYAIVIRLLGESSCQPLPPPF